jgi:hypothetical protein
VPTAELLELNALLADPKRWPRAILAEWIIPAKALPRNIRRFGGTKLGIDWCREHGYPDITPPQMEGHFNRHVVHIAKNDNEVEELGKMALTATADPALALMPSSRPQLFIDYYATGIQLGVFALNQLKANVEEVLRNGGKIPPTTLWQLAELGAKLSQSQATIQSRGAKMEEGEDEMAGFRRGEAPLPSQRFGDHRVRTIEGVARPVVDAGKADRDQYNKRAKEEGSPTFDA